MNKPPDTKRYLLKAGVSKRRKIMILINYKDIERVAFLSLKQNKGEILKIKR